MNRAALPAPDNSRLSEEQTYIAPRFEAERDLARLFAEVLQRPRVGVTDNFFSELGVNASLGVVEHAQLVARRGTFLASATS